MIRFVTSAGDVLTTERVQEILLLGSNYQVSMVEVDDWPRPIPVSERLPEDDREVLAYGSTWWVAELVNGRWEEPGSVGLQDVDVTHWLPLPPPPE